MISNDRYQDWIETDANQYSGEYVYFEFKESKVKTEEKIIVSIQDKLLHVQYLKDNNPKEEFTTTLHSNSFKFQFKSVRGKARFMFKLPPTNAKGKILNGILIKAKFFSRVEPLE